jgi:hypothetical protein
VQLDALLIVIRVFVYTWILCLSFQQLLSRNPVFSGSYGYPLTDFGHDKNKKENLYNELN